MHNTRTWAFWSNPTRTWPEVKKPYSSDPAGDLSLVCRQGQAGWANATISIRQKSYYVLARVQPSLERKHAVPCEGLAARYPLPHSLRPRLLLSQRVSWTIGAQGRRHHCWLWRKTRPGKSSINIWWGWDLILPLHRLLRPWNFLKQNLGFCLSRLIFSCSNRKPTLHRHTHFSCLIHSSGFELR